MATEDEFDMMRDIGMARDALQRAVELADKGGHDEAVFYMKAALAGMEAGRALIQNAKEGVASGRR